MSRSRAQRRHYSAQSKKRAVRRLHACHPEARRTLCAVQVGLEAKTPTRCSCWMCGNPRKHYGNGIRSLQEKKADASFVAALNDL